MARISQGWDGARRGSPFLVAGVNQVGTLKTDRFAEKSGLKRSVPQRHRAKSREHRGRDVQSRDVIDKWWASSCA